MADKPAISTCCVEELPNPDFVTPEAIVTCTCGTAWQAKAAEVSGHYWVTEGISWGGTLKPLKEDE